jgi:hypothetical protein
MKRRILENLTRQHLALKQLLGLQKEEFAYLTEFHPQSVSKVEFSIQELIRQVQAERLSLKNLLGQVNPGAKRLWDLRESWGRDWDIVKDLLQDIHVTEQACARQADKSHRLAVALLDQSASYVEFFRKQLAPPKAVYGRRGVMASYKPGPAIMKGAG